MADANATTVVNDGYNVATFAQFLRWWKTHLWECVPEGLRASARKNARPMMISLADDAIWPERSDLAKPLRISKTTFLSGDASKTKPVALVVGEAHGLRRKVELPLAVEERLSQVLAYELDRLTPLRADELYYDFRLLSRNVARGTCIVELIAAPKKRVNEMIALANTKGAEVTRLVLSASDIDDGVDLLRATSKDESKQDNKRWITPALLALCGVLVVALVAYPLFKKRQYVIAMMPIEASARADAEAASVVQRQLERQLTEYNHLLKRKHASPIAVQVLEDLTKRLPDDTWAQSFEIKAIASAPPGQHPREVIVQGETGSGGKLLQLVQESTMLKDPVLKAAMTRVSPNAERFHFAGELVSVAPPPGLSLADSSAVLGTPMQVVPNSVGAAAATRSSSPTAAPSAVTSSTATPSPATAAPAVGKSDGTQLPSTAPAAVPQPAVPAPMKGASQLTPPTPQSTGASVDYAKKSISNPVPPQNPNPGAMQQNVAPFLQQEERK
jgi:general secretion pathway protein L